MFFRLGQLASDYRIAVILVWLLIAVGMKIAAPPWSEVARDGDLEHLPASTTTVRAARLSAQAFPDERAKSQIVLVFARDDGPLSVEDRQFVFDLAHSIEQLSDLPIVDVWTEKTKVVGPLLKSRSGRAGRLVIRLTNEFMATDNIRVLNRVAHTLLQQQGQAPSGLELGLTGSAAIGGDMLAAASESVRNTHLTTILLVAGVLLVIYRSPSLVLVPLLAIGISTSISFDLLALFADGSQAYPDFWPTIRVFTTTKIFVVVLMFGAGTDYCLFLAARFREQRATGQSQRDALATALGNVGVALAASALTTIVGLAMMGWAEFGKFAYSGPAIAICLAVTLLSCVTLVPALLATRLGAAVSPQIDKSSSHTFSESMWHSLADFILRRPGAILMASLLLFAPLVWLGWHVEVTYDLLGELPAERISRHGTQLLQRHFPAGEIGPLVVLAQPTQGDLDSVDGQVRIAQLAKPLDDLPGIDQVRSLYQPTGNPPGATSLFSAKGLQLLAAKGSPLTKAAFVSQTPDLAGKVTRLFLIPVDAPFSAAAVATCIQVERVLAGLSADPESPWYNATFELAGPTPGIRDLQRITLADRNRIQWLVTGAVLLVIVVLLRRPLICLFLIATVLLSYLATLGITGQVFQTLYGQTYIGLDWKLPLFLFVILVAVGQDYNIYLVSRVLEEQRRLGQREGLRRAIVQTGGIITSCGVIMAGTFISMTTGSLRGMVELGFALSLGILLDTFVVRTILVPAFLALLIKEKAVGSGQ